MTIPWAKCIRRIPSVDCRVYLTFDDGPDPACTPFVLDLLAKYDAKASFFVIGKRAELHRDLLERILSEGHAVGNHSFDHNTMMYFSSLANLRTRLENSEQHLQSLIGRPSLGFRSPAGVRTPHLHVALAQLALPWVHWSMRFYDTALPWTEARSKAGVARLQPGDIVLLHDTQAERRRGLFLNSLEAFITSAHRRGFQFSTIQREDVR